MQGPYLQEHYDQNEERYHPINLNIIPVALKENPLEQTIKYDPKVKSVRAVKSASKSY